jgi:hypothetical protein
MYVTVSLKIELDASANLSEMESQIQQAGREAMKEAPKQAIRQSEGYQKTCPECGSERVQTQGTKRRVSASQFRACGSPSQATALSAMWPSISPGGALFGRSQRTQRHAGLSIPQIFCDECQQVPHLERFCEKIIGTGIPGHILRVFMG